MAAKKKVTKKKITKKKVKSKAAKATVTKTKKDSIEQTHVDFESHSPTDKPLCEISFGLSRTYNLGNYESVKMDVRIMIPCVEEKIELVFEDAQSWVDTKITELGKDINDSDDDDSEEEEGSDDDDSDDSDDYDFD